MRMQSSSVTRFESTSTREDGQCPGQIKITLYDSFAFQTKTLVCLLFGHHPGVFLLTLLFSGWHNWTSDFGFKELCCASNE